MPEPLASRLGPLVTEARSSAPAAPSSDVRERLRTAPPPRRQPLESRLGRPNDQNQTTCQTSARASNLPATTRAPAGNPSASTASAEDIQPNNLLLWNRPDPSGWRQYEADMLASLNMNKLTCRSYARKLMYGDGPTVSGLYRIPIVNWLLAEQEQFSSATTLRFVDLDELPQDNTFGPLNLRPSKGQRLDTTTRRGMFVAENRPNNKHHKMYWQFSKPPDQLSDEYSRDYPRATSVEGDDRRYEGLKVPMGDSLFAAYDPLGIKSAKYLILASSDYLYTPRSLFWPDVIFLTAPELDWGQAVGMRISVQRTVFIDQQIIIIIASLNDDLRSRELMTRRTDGSVPSNVVMGEAIMTLLSAMTEAERSVQQRFTKNVRKIIFVLSPGYAALREPLHFVYTMDTRLAEGRFNVVIPALNRYVDPNNYYPLALSFLLSGWTYRTPSKGSSSIARRVWCWMKSWCWKFPTSSGC